MTKKKVNGQSPVVSGVGQAVDYAVMNDANISRDQIREWLEKDIKSVHVLLTEILATPPVLEAITDVFYGRYKRLHEQKPEPAPAPLFDQPKE